MAELVTRALREPRSLIGLMPTDWDCLVRQARSAGLLGRLAVLAEDAGLLEAIDAGPRAHLESALVLAEAQRVSVVREVRHVRDALSGLGFDIVVLKGAAYVLSALPAARGRFFSDLDILVPRDSLAAVEANLMLHGWTSTHHVPYDQHYYRRWMHELPPMQHLIRKTVVDVHHAIVPTTARLKPSTAKLMASARAIHGWQGLKVPAPADMVLHSATHLFYNDDLSSGLRDLSDLDLLLRHFAAEPNFWECLLDRANELGLKRPLYYCLANALRVFATPIPESVISSVQAAAPNRPIAQLMQRLWSETLLPFHPSSATSWTPLCRSALYVRAHWLRMPPALLVYHLTRKALRAGQRSEE